MKNNKQKTVLSRYLSKEKTRKDYSKVAWFYDLWGLLTESKANKKLIELAQIKDGENILEVAVGTGKIFTKIVMNNQSGKNEGIDLSPSMLAYAAKKLEKFDKKSFNLQVGDAYEIPFNDNTFDLLINNYMLDLLPEKDFIKILNEFKRVLKPNGRIVISTMSFGVKWRNKFWHWLAKYFPNVLTGCRPISIHNYLEKTGFANIKTEQISQNTFPSEIIYAINQKKLGD